MKSPGAARPGCAAAFIAAAAMVAGGWGAGAAPAATCAGEDVGITGGNIAASEAALHCLVSAYRQDNGRGALTRDPRLDLAARRHSEDMVSRGYFDHRAVAPAPYGVEPWDRAKTAGFPSDQTDVSENLACGEDPATPRLLFEAWQASAGHNANMLAPKWVLSGMGIAAGAPNADICDFTSGATATNLLSTAPSSGGNGGGGIKPPKQGERVVLAPTRGSIRIKLPGSSRYRLLKEDDDVPIRTTIDATKGAVQVSSDYRGTTELAEFASGVFQALQPASGDPTFSAKLAGSFVSGTTAAARDAGKKRRAGRRRLWASSDGGHFRTRGRRGAATVRGTRWLTADIRSRSGKVSQTWFKSTQGVLEIDDFAIAGSVNARIGPGESYLAGKKKRRR